MRFRSSDAFCNHSEVKKMTCEEACQHLAFLDDGDLTPSTEQELREHLDQCSSCRKEYAGIRATRALVSRAMDRAPSQSDEAAAAAVLRAVRTRRNHRFQIRFLEIAATVILVIGAGLYPMLANRYEEQHLLQNVDVVQDDQYAEYIAEGYFNGYELYALVAEMETFDTDDALEVLVDTGHMSMSLGDYVEPFDDAGAYEWYIGNP